MFNVDIKKKFLEYISTNTKVIFEKHFKMITKLGRDLQNDQSLLSILLQIRFWESQTIISKEINSLLKEVYSNWTENRYSKQDMLRFISYYLDLSETNIIFKSNLIIVESQKPDIKQDEIEKFQKLLKESEFVKSIEKYLGNDFK